MRVALLLIVACSQPTKQRDPDTSGNGSARVVTVDAMAIEPDAAGCNSYAFDPSNPDCQGKCDFKNPDPNNQACCEMWGWWCVRGKGQRTCTAPELAWDGDQIVIPVGLERGVHGSPKATLIMRFLPRLYLLRGTRNARASMFLL